VGVAIGRKFLLQYESRRPAVDSGIEIVEGHLASTARSPIRLRVAGEAATLSSKRMTPGVRREEFAS